VKCPKCGTSKVFDFDKCPSCGHVMYNADAPDQPSTVQEAISNHSSSIIPLTTGAIQVLKFFAWLDLIISIIGSIIIWGNYGKTASDFYSLSTTNPIAIGIGIAVLLQGVFVCAFFLVIASIAENIIVIRNNTTKQMDTATQD
jgi:hypothetical protein